MIVGALCASGAQLCVAQETSKVTLDVSEALFSVVSGLNACGYDQNLSESDAIRTQVRREINQALEASDEAQAARQDLCTFTREHVQPDASRQLSQYVSLALNLGPPPEFVPSVKEADLPPDASYVLGYVPLLKRFYIAAGLHRIWEKHKGEYDAQIERFHEPVSNMILATDVYLRNPISGYLGRKFTVYLEPMAAPGQVNARNYGSDYYIVVSPERGQLAIDQIRHTYLHYLLDPLAMKRAQSMRRLLPLLAEVQTAPLDDVYKKDIALLATESLIRALEARFLGGQKKNDQAAEAARAKVVAADLAEGFVLTDYFYDQLSKFEGSPQGLKDAYPDWLYYLDVGRERKRAQSIQFASKAAPEVVAASKPRQTSPLDEAERRLHDNDLAGAQEIARPIAEQNGADSGRALFILAQAATLSKDIDGAVTYYERTLQVSHEPRLLAWSHIYLGRIFDLQKDRETAVQHYRAALAAGDAAPQTKAAAERGLQQPYQSSKSRD